MGLGSGSTLKRAAAATPAAEAAAGASSGSSRAANRIATCRTSTAAGTGTYHDSGYDCCGSVSYALHYAGLLERRSTRPAS